MTTQTPAIPPTMNKSVRKTITVPKISVEKMDISTNTMIMLTFLLLTFFIGYVHTSLTSRIDLIDSHLSSRMDRMESRMENRLAKNRKRYFRDKSQSAADSKLYQNQIGAFAPLRE